MYQKARLLPQGDSALVMEFSNSIEPKTNARIRSLLNSLGEEELESLGILELIPSYRSVLFVYDPLKTDFHRLADSLEKLDQEGGDDKESAYRLVNIPVLYGGKVGPDLDFVSEHAGLSKEEVIRIHTDPEYLVYMLGFTPGFSYLGGLDSRIFTPRLKSARIRIPAGSVGIADKQTGIYPIASPGGWQLIGRTPLPLYMPEEDPPVLLRAGDHIKFKSIGEEEYKEIEEAIESGTYEFSIEKKEGRYE